MTKVNNEEVYEELDFDRQLTDGDADFDNWLQHDETTQDSLIYRPEHTMGGFTRA